MPSWRDLAKNDLTTNAQLESVNGRLELVANSSPSESRTIALLDSQAVLSVKGDDAVKFIQGQCTADIAQLEIGQSTLGAICTNKGRVISNFRALRTSDAILLRMSADIAKEALDRIKKYAAFFKVEMSIWEPPSVAVALEGNDTPLATLPAGIYYADGEQGSTEFYAEPGQATTLLGLLAADKMELASESAWYAMQIRSGVTSVNVCNIEEYLPHQLNLDRSGAVSFTKGCYTGQEIVARTEYRGKTKRRVQAVLIDTNMLNLHDIKLQLDTEAQTEISLLDSAAEEGKTVAALLLPTDLPKDGNLLVNGQPVRYCLLPLPYSMEG